MPRVKVKVRERGGLSRVKAEGRGLIRGVILREVILYKSGAYKLNGNVYTGYSLRTIGRIVPRYSLKIRL